MNNLNPLVTDLLYLACMAKISIFKKEGIIGVFLYYNFHIRPTVLVNERLNEKLDC